MVTTTSGESDLERRFGPASFVAALLNVPIALSPALLLMLGGISYFFLFVVLLDLVVAFVLVFLRGRAGQIGRGMLIAWVTLPVMAVVIIGVVIVRA